MIIAQFIIYIMLVSAIILSNMMVMLLINNKFLSPIFLFNSGIYGLIIFVVVDSLDAKWKEFISKRKYYLGFYKYSRLFPKFLGSFLVIIMMLSNFVLTKFNLSNISYIFSLLLGLSIFWLADHLNEKLKLVYRLSGIMIMFGGMYAYLVLS